MSPSGGHGRPSVVVRLRSRLPAVAWLTVVWVLLWGTFTLRSLVGGLLVAALVVALFPMPVAADRLPVRPVRVLGLVAYLVYDVVASGIEVAWQVLRDGPRARSAIVAVPLLTTSDRVETVMANAVSLSPGTMAMQTDHEGGVWYVYVLGPRDAAGVERARVRTLDMQRRVLAALGSPEEQAEADRWMREARTRGEGR